jgi:hypothetical protein
VVMMALLRKEWPQQKVDQPGASIVAQKTLS